MKRFLFFFFLSISIFNTGAQIKLSDNAEISILTSTPTDEAVFTIYGHTAIRVFDPEGEIDYVFNYGIFDFSSENFIYRFTKGETDYKLEATHFNSYVIGYQMRGSGISEQVLNLTQEEKNKIWNALLINLQPQNQVYRYNFFFDNCATRPIGLIEKNVEGKIVYLPSEHPQTFRELINYCSRNQPWLTFGTDLALGSPTDRIATQHEEMFLPLYLEASFDKAIIVSEDGVQRKLVKETRVIAEEDLDEDDIATTILTPLIVCWLLFLIIVLITYLEWRRKKYFRLVDCILFFIAGMAGIILYFLAFISEHPATCPNWLLIWLHPFHLIGVILFSVKKWNKAAYCYHFINFAALTLMLLGWHWIPQHFNTAFIPLVLIFWMRSGFGIYRHKILGIE